MKASSATSGAAPNAAEGASATPTGAPHSASSPTRTADTPPGGFPLPGPSTRPDPRTHAYRQDLADVALAGTVIASHYAEPLAMILRQPAILLAEPSDTAEPLRDLPAGTEMRVLDRGRDWAWGYAEGLVGYVPASAL